MTNKYKIGIKVFDRLTPLVKLRLEKIKYFLNKGITDHGDLAKLLDISESNLRKHMEWGHVRITEIPGLNATPNDIANITLKAFESGERDLEKICKWLWVKPSGHAKVRKDFGIDLPEDIIPYTYRPEIDRLVDDGWSRKDIGDYLGISKQAVSQYLTFAGSEYLHRKNNGIRNAFDLPLTIRDVAYYIGVSNKEVNKRFEGLVNERGEKRLLNLKSYKGGFTFRGASEVYRMKDQKKSALSIRDKLKMSINLYFHIIDNREKFEKQIIKYLNKIFPGRGISEPYLRKNG